MKTYLTETKVAQVSLIPRPSSSAQLNVGEGGDGGRQPWNEASTNKVPNEN